MRKQKKGQVAVFIIVGLVLLFAVATFFIFKNQVVTTADGETLTTSLEFLGESEFLDTCMAIASEDAVMVNGLKGGLYAPRFYVFGEFRAPLATFYIDGRVIAPSTDDVARSIGLEFNDLFTACVSEYDLDALMMTGEIQTLVAITNDSILFDVVYPVTFDKGGNRQIFRNYKYTVDNIRLLLILDVAYQLSYEQSLDPEYLCATCALELADANYMWIDYTDIGDLKTVYTITDLFSSIDGSPYIFMMAHEH
jgi:hypothetical protein